MKKNDPKKKDNKDYHCDGVCEICKFGKHFGDPQRGYDMCDEDKIKGLNIIAPTPPNFTRKK